MNDQFLLNNKLFIRKSIVYKQWTFLFPDWSILYVVIVCFLIVITCTGALWACVCCWQRKRYVKPITNYLLNSFNLDSHSGKLLARIKSTECGSDVDLLYNSS